MPLVTWPGRAGLASAVLAVADRCQDLAGRGVPAAAIEEQDFSPILRAREEAATPEAVAERERAMLARLDDLGRSEEQGREEGRAG